MSFIAEVIKYGKDIVLLGERADALMEENPVQRLRSSR